MYKVSKPMELYFGLLLLHNKFGKSYMSTIKSEIMMLKVSKNHIDLPIMTGTSTTGNNIPLAAKNLT